MATTEQTKPAVPRGEQRGAREALLSVMRRALQVKAPHPGAHTPHDPVQERKPDAPVAAAADGTNIEGSNVNLENGKPVDAGSGQIGEANKDGAVGWSQPLTVLGSDTPAWRGWLPHVGETWEEQAALFGRNSAELKTDFQVLANRDEMVAVLRRMRDEAGWKRIATHSGELTDAAADALDLPVCRTDGGYDPFEMEQCEVGITQCDAVVAQTGSVLITCKSAGGRTLSILPPHHIVLARRDQLVPDLTVAFAVLRETYGDNFPSLISFVTGPSRTGDIERILVLGAHGPKQLTVLCF
jgi:L-lactate dehydrogenase complex protein LldG